MKNIILIGFMGVGKGSVAREIVKLSKLVSVDTDDMIESMENRSVKEIFVTDGEKYFRSLEKKIAKWLEHNVENTLISTGGGFYKQRNLKKIGTVVLLNSPFENILERITSHPNAEKKLKKRPLLSDLQKAKELYEARLPEYMKVADFVIDVTDKSAQKSAKEIIKKAKKYA